MWCATALVAGPDFDRGVTNVQVCEPQRDLALAAALRAAMASPGGCMRAPGHMRALLMRLQVDTSQVRCLEPGELAHPERPLAKLVQAALACAPSTLERFSSTAPGRAPLLPLMPNLAHLTLHLTNPARIAGWLGMCATGSSSYFPALQSLVLLGRASTSHSAQALDELHLEYAAGLRAVYLDGLMPDGLLLPLGCALHWSAPCSFQDAAPMLAPMPVAGSCTDLYSNLHSLCNARMDCPSDGLISPHALPPGSMCQWLRALTLRCASKDVLFGDTFGTADQPFSLAPLRMLERFMMNSEVAVFLQVPPHVRPWSFCVTSTSSLTLAFEALAEFASGLKDLGLQSDNMQGLGLHDLYAELDRRGLPVVSQLQGRDMPQGRCVVIRGCRFDCEAEKPACQCYTCLDCLVERASQHLPETPAPF